MKPVITRARVAWVLGLAIAVPAATAGARSFFTPPPQPCFVAGAHAYRIAGSGNAAITVRVDNTAADPTMRMQLVNDPATADFVLVDDSDSATACRGVNSIKTIRLDRDAAKPDLTVALSHQPAPYKIYVRSAHYTPQDAAALFAVMRRDARGPELAARD